MFKTELELFKALTNGKIIIREGSGELVYFNDKGELTHEYEAVKEKRVVLFKPKKWSIYNGH